MKGGQGMKDQKEIQALLEKDDRLVELILEGREKGYCTKEWADQAIEIIKGEHTIERFEKLMDLADAMGVMVEKIDDIRKKTT
jgi:hypothetical protein